MYQPRFTITPEINNNIAQIERIRATVEASRILPKEEIILRYRALIDAVHSSTSIEGNPLDIKQVEEVLAGKMTQASQRAILEVQNYKRALDWIERRLQVKKPISVTDILKLHRITMNGLLPDEKVGKFRSGPIYVVDIHGKEEKVRYIGPDSKKLLNLYKELFTWIRSVKDNLHPILAAGILHYEFVSIHPFSDGNGRVTRLLTLFFLRKNGYGFRNVLVPDVYYLQNRPGYYQALNQAKMYSEQRIADLTPWLAYFINGIYEAAKELEHDISLIKLSSNSMKTIRLNRQEIKVLDFARQMGQVTLTDVLDILEIPKRTAQRRLANLVEKNLLKSQGAGKNIFYVL